MLVSTYDSMDSRSSTDSGNSTIPVSPQSDSSDALNLDGDEVFAWIRPLSDDAQKAFNATANLVIKHAPDFDHVRPFLHCDARQHRSQSVFSEDDDAAPDPSSQNPQWNGAFGLRLTHLPGDPLQGWRMGSQMAEDSTKLVDLLLVPPKKRWKKLKIASHHATLRIHPDSCRISLEARHLTIVTRNGIRKFRNSESFLLENGEIICLGNCTYTFEYTTYFRSAAFDDALKQCMRRCHGAQWFMNEHIAPSSVGLPVPLGQYYCSPSAFGEGTFGKISAGWTQSGELVAIKTFKQPRRSQVDSHEQLMNSIGKHVRDFPIARPIAKGCDRKTFFNC